MRTHDDDPGRAAPDTVSAARNAANASAVAQRALAEGRTNVLDSTAVAHLQRTAGNAGVSSLLGGDQERESPVLGVVGSGGGQPLDAGTRNEMESAFGHDFGAVRVHSDSKASESAKAVQAQAYTVGNDVVFQEGKYAPDSPSGKRTLAHELAHVVQQRSGPVDGTPTDGGISVSDPSDRYEQAAEHAADRVVSGHHAGPESGGGGSGASVQREADGEGPAVQGFVQRQGEAADEDREDKENVTS